ncbi:hypothetical protein [Shinella sp. BYT-45]|uniref:hypothetical protein n=1 Tax=Shinella sp. BYT-45 TaxID=3377377 RepID=UPI00397F4FD1
MKITRRQRDALSWLNARHIIHPQHSQFATVHLGVNTASLLRRLVPLGLVSVTPGGPGRRQFFAITEKGRAALQEAA